jgi:RecA-family ATPase
MAQEGGYQFKPLRSTPQEDFGDFDIESGEIKFTINNGSKNPWKDRIHAISTNLVPPNWLIDGLLADKMTMIAGSPGVGKTSCLVPLALVVAGFQSHLSNVSSKYNRKVIYVTEDKWQIDSIIHGVIKHMVTPDGKKITYEMIAERFIVVETVKSRIPDIIRLADLAADYALQIGNIKMNPLVVFDTSSASFQIDDENNNAEASKFVAALKENFIKYHIPVWIVAHTAKVNKRADVAALSVRGAGAFEGDANCVAYLVAEEGVDKRYFILGKHRYAAKYREVAIDSVVHQEMALNIYGDPEDVYYRYSTLERSSEGQRIAAKEEAKADKAEFKNQMYRDRIFYAVDTLDDPIISKVAKFKGDPTKNYELIERMVTEGELHLIDTGRIHKGQPVMLVKRVQK